MTARPTIVLTVPRPPSANKLWSHVPGKPRIKSREYRSWLRTAGWDVKRQMVGCPTLTIRYDMEIKVPISSRDTPNWEKPIGDLLQRVGVVSNDGNVNRVVMEPMERDDCLVTLTERPDLGHIRKPARVGPIGYVAPTKPTRKRLDQLANVRGRVPF